MRARPLLCSTLACAALAGCGSDDLPGAGVDPPSEGRIVADSVRALARAGAPRFRYRLDVHAEAEAGDDAGILGRLTGEAIELELEGGFSPEALVAAGSARALGEEREGELRAGRDEVYVRVGDAWYGHRGDGLDIVLDGPPRADAERLAAAIEATGDELVDGDASGGPKVDGEETWQIEGKLNAEAAASIAKALRAPAAAAQVDRALGDARISYAAGRTDHLPRRIELRVPLDRDDLSFLGGGLPLERVELTIEAELTDWGRPVSFERPADAKPFEQLLGPLLLGIGLGGSGELGGAGPPVLAPPPPPEVEVPSPPVEVPAPPPVHVPPPPQVQPPPPPAPVPPPPAGDLHRPPRRAAPGKLLRQRPRRPAEPPLPSSAAVRLLSFRDYSGAVRVGELRDDRVRELAAPSMIDWLAGLGREPAGPEHALDDVALVAPVPEPPSVRDFFAFEGHVATGWRLRGGEIPPAWYEAPVFYFSNPASIRGPGEAVARPAATQALDFELEVAAVIGADPPSGGQAATIAGFTLMNDWSARDVQRTEMTVGLGPAKGKDFATSLGPWLSTPDELPYEDGRLLVEATVSVNGREVTRTSSGEQHWSWPELVAHAARDTRLRPGDVLGSGTLNRGCLLELGGDWIEPGDVVVLEAAGLGRLHTPVV